MKALSIIILALSLIGISNLASADVAKLDLAQFVPASSPFAWKIKKATWRASDEAAYSAFIVSLGAAVESRKCNTVETCMKSSANPFHSSDPVGLKYYADCADLPYYLRAYFAWKNGLPFSFVSRVDLRNPNDPNGADIRYPRDGNKPIGRTDTSGHGPGYFTNAKDILNWVVGDSVSTATIRMPSIPQPREALGDFYAIPVRRGELHPGTVIYSADGHAAVVYKIPADGLLQVIDAHPDNAMTLTSYGPRFQRGNPNMGAIFKNFRPLELVGATPDAEGNLVGGTIVAKPDAQIPGVSDEQVTTKFPNTPAFQMWVRQRLAEVGFRIDLVTDFKQSVQTLCRLVQQRKEAVDKAITDQIDKKDNPALMVANIFGAADEWEMYSSPGRDVSLRIGFKAALDNAKYNVDQLKIGNPLFSYAGTNMAADLYKTYQETAASCPLSYTSRDGSLQKLDLEQIRLRLFKISFDPYHCIDLRWGDVDAGKRVCGEDMRWYDAEQYLRNLTERDEQANDGYDITGTETVNAAKSAAPVWDTNIIGYLQSLATSAGLTLK
jgi:hypothetical protein